jgi:hypothetical protein
MSLPRSIRDGGWSESQMDLGISILQVEKELCLALALQESRPLRARALAGVGSLLLKLPIGAGCMRIQPDGVRISRDDATDGDAPDRSFLDLFGDPSFMSSSECERATEAVHARATKLLGSLFRDDRRSFNSLLEWGPLLESSVYTVASRILMVVEKTRRETYEACARELPTSGEIALRYRRLVDALGRTTLVSTDAGSPWLAKMATSFDWTHWTPSFSLTRERDVWGSLVGARSASRFGPAVVDRYFEVLRKALHPMFALDAIVGLTAIGLHHPSERSAIAKSLENEMVDLPRREILRPDFVLAGHVEARTLLDEGRSGRLAVPSRKRDAFDADTTGRMPVFEQLPAAVDCPIWQFIPASNEAGTMSPRMARGGFLRAWDIGQPSLNNYPDAAFGHA